MSEEDFSSEEDISETAKGTAAFDEGQPSPLEPHEIVPSQTSVPSIHSAWDNIDCGAMMEIHADKNDTTEMTESFNVATLRSADHNYTLQASSNINTSDHVYCSPETSNRRQETERADDESPHAKTEILNQPVLSSKLTKRVVVDLQTAPAFVEHGYASAESSKKTQKKTSEPRQANLCLRAFRHDKF